MVNQLREGRDILGRPQPPVPPEWTAAGGTEPEYFIFRALERLGFRHTVDFDYQSSAFGGRLSRGGIVPDFLIFNPRVGINVQGARFHFPPLGDPARDRIQRASLEAQGIRMEFISETEARNNPEDAVRSALRGTRGRGPNEAFGV